jgi:hypothetical protein
MTPPNSPKCLGRPIDPSEGHQLVNILEGRIQFAFSIFLLTVLLFSGRNSEKFTWHSLPQAAEKILQRSISSTLTSCFHRFGEVSVSTTKRKDYNETKAAWSKQVHSIVEDSMVLESFANSARPDRQTPTSLRCNGWHGYREFTHVPRKNPAIEIRDAVPHASPVARPCFPSRRTFKPIKRSHEHGCNHSLAADSRYKMAAARGQVGCSLQATRKPQS